MSSLQYALRILPVLLLSCTAVKQAQACACGCGVFDVGTASVLPNGPGGTVWAEYDYLPQTHNWHHGSDAPDVDNDDKKVRTNYYNLGAQYLFNRDWGARIILPYVDRNFVTTDDASGAIVSSQKSSLGDIRLSGIYTGFSSDMSAGVTFGVKLPTGDFRQLNFDRDSAIGTGSTDLLLGAYKMGRFHAQHLGWFANAQIDQPILTADHYRPGTEIDGAVGTYYEDAFMPAGHVKITPLLQVLAVQRFHDNGVNADEDGSGYTRLLLSPGVEIAHNNTRLYGDVEVPVAQYVHGDQLVSTVQFKLTLAQDF